MNSNIFDAKKVSTREFQHNLSDYLEIAKNMPVLITRYGKEEAVLINPKHYKIAKLKSKKTNLQNIMSSPFIGLHKNKKDWQKKSSVQIANELKIKAWYGG